MALKSCEKTPLEKLQQTRGMVTLKMVPNNFERRRLDAKKEYTKLEYRYSQPKPIVFRETDPGVVLKFGQTDFALKTHPDQLLPNPHGLSVHNPRPKFWSERERLLEERAAITKGLEGTAKWEQYHKKLPQKHEAIAQTFKDRFVKKETSPFLE